MIIKMRDWNKKRDGIPERRTKLLLIVGSSIIIEGSIVIVFRWHIIDSFFMMAYIFSLKLETKLFFWEGWRRREDQRFEEHKEVLKKALSMQQRSQLKLFRSVTEGCWFLRSWIFRGIDLQVHLIFTSCGTALT